MCSSRHAHALFASTAAAVYALMSASINSRNAMQESASKTCSSTRQREHSTFMETNFCISPTKKTPKTETDNADIQLHRPRHFVWGHERIRRNQIRPETVVSGCNAVLKSSSSPRAAEQFLRRAKPMLKRTRTCSLQTLQHTGVVASLTSLRMPPEQKCRELRSFLPSWLANRICGSTFAAVRHCQ